MSVLGTLYIIAAPSGTGKTSLVGKLLFNVWVKYWEKVK